ncbi:DUF4395 domain-containing protein [Psychroserpens damuponensis]|uniref:DUF4395 domain-containing protein n=1 Tax=Psychroserpens damuponensis TaxID=943936 RepID=UPI00058D094A|nr:DUF4395 domain-containing protein [Psychroserpens damuponensis]
MNTIICPISKEKIDNNVSRVTMFFSVVLMLTFIYTKNPIYILVATTDTLVRAWLNVKYSPIKWLATFIINRAKTSPVYIDLAKKVFASRLGMLCGVASVVLFYLNFESASFIITGFWAFLAILDSVFNFCLGCIIYTYVSTIKSIR